MKILIDTTRQRPYIEWVARCYTRREMMMSMNARVEMVKNVMCAKGFTSYRDESCAFMASFSFGMSQTSLNIHCAKYRLRFNADNSADMRILRGWELIDIGKGTTRTGMTGDQLMAYIEEIVR